MAENKKFQKIAGTTGRHKGHSYEDSLAKKLNELPMPYSGNSINSAKILFYGKPEIILLDKVLNYIGWTSCTKIKAYGTGKLATSEYGDGAMTIDGHSIKSTKSDVLVVIENNNQKKTLGISVKQCNNKTPTNAQVYFTTATAFYKLVVENGFALSNKALIAMQQFCGDAGFRPRDHIDCSKRIPTPERYFWEEIDSDGRKEWETLFKNHQDEVTKLLLQKGYSDDPFPPEIIFHKTKKIEGTNEEIAVFTMDKFIELSKKFSKFTCSQYRVCKGSHKEPEWISHLAPRFGVVQMQRGGQKQHPTQLQFNLKAGYFYELSKL